MLDGESCSTRRADRGIYDDVAWNATATIPYAEHGLVVADVCGHWDCTVRTTSFRTSARSLPISMVCRCWAMQRRRSTPSPLFFGAFIERASLPLVQFALWRSWT